VRSFLTKKEYFEYIRSWFRVQFGEIIVADQHLEILKLIVSASVPAVLAYFGWHINRQIKSIEQAQWQNRKIIEKRIEIYDQLAPKFNSILCFCVWVGDWKEITPDQMINLKRSTDKSMNVYKHLFSDDLFFAYNDFIHTVFRTFTRAGEDAKIRADISGAYGNRKTDCRYSWKNEWNKLFDAAPLPQREEISSKYETL